MLSQNILLVRGHRTHLCWTVDTGRYDPGTLIVLDACDVANPHQHFVRENYSYDVETGSYSWLWRPVGWEEEAEVDRDEESQISRESEGRSQGNRKGSLYVVGHNYSMSSEQGGRWRMVLDELPEGVTEPLTQVFWTIGSHDENNMGASSSHAEHPDVNIDLMGMGQHAYSTRLFVTNEGDVADRDVPVVLRTETNIHQAVERSKALDRIEEGVYQLNGHDGNNEVVAGRKSLAVDAGTVAGAIPGKWSYIRVGYIDLHVHRPTEEEGKRNLQDYQGKFHDFEDVISSLADTTPLEWTGMQWLCLIILLTVLSTLFSCLCGACFGCCRPRYGYGYYGGRRRGGGGGGRCSDVVWCLCCFEWCCRDCQDVDECCDAAYRGM